MVNRRKAIENIFKGIGILGTGGLIWGTAAKAASDLHPVLRPPGAIPEHDFKKACIKCGKCVEVCPYDTLKLANVDDDSFIGTPYFEPRKTPCYLCTDAPCTTECPTNALDITKLQDEQEKIDINKSKMGLAVVHKESCIAFWGIQCVACYRSCPLISEAITLEYEKNEVTKKHANLIPVIHSDICTGCGICEHACVVEKAAIKILPVELAEGEVGDHYIKSWDKNDENRMQEKNASHSNDKDVESSLDYLNDENELFD